jgi:hypothetical protein
MKPYSNKTARVDDRRCLYSEIRGGDRARKKAKRKQGRDEIKEELVASGSWDRTVRIWDVETGEVRLRIVPKLTGLKGRIK